MNVMQTIRIEKITINIGAGKSTDRLEKGIKLINSLVGVEPVKTKTSKRIPGWGLRPGLPIGCKLTLRGKKAKDVLARFLGAKDNLLDEKQFDNSGNVAFGIPEYIDIPDAKYEPTIGIMGFQVCVTLEKPGHRIKRRRKEKKTIPNSHRVTKEEAIDFMNKEFGVTLKEE